MAATALQEMIACLGHPVGGNPTQYVMERAFEAAGVDSRCLTVDVAPEDLAAAIAGMDAMGFRGAILASPHQASACQYVAQVSEEARVLGEIDLIYRSEGELIGDNSLVRAVTELLARTLDLADRRVVVLGAGVAARAAALAAARAGVRQLTVLARQDAAAEALVALIQPHASGEVVAQAWLDLYRFPPQTDAVLQATSCDGSEETSQLSLDYEALWPELVLLDTVFNPPRTPLIRAGEQAGCTTINGLEVLVQRAVVAFQLWTGTNPDTTVVREAFEEFLMI